MIDFYIISGYCVWYTHECEPDIDGIPSYYDIKFHELTLQQLRDATQGLHITHMYISLDSPPQSRLLFIILKHYHIATE